ncbi:hypothetical protein ACNOYE_05355 [Nannocystaceae bacterium ST9]
MPSTRDPSDGERRSLAELFERWQVELDELEAELVIPAIDPLEPGVGPGRGPSQAWKDAMRRRNDRLHPLAAELAWVYRVRLDAEQRRRLVALVDEHRLVAWQLPGVIQDYFDRCLQSLAQPDFDLAFALIAIYDDRAMSRDFARMVHPFHVGLRERGLSPTRLFGDALALAIHHDDPERGAHGFFRHWADDTDDTDDTD